jgi:hypothetical protein
MNEKNQSLAEREQERNNKQRNSKKTLDVKFTPDKKLTGPNAPAE